MSKTKQDIEDEREDEYLTAEMQKSQEQKEVRRVKTHQLSAANAFHGAEQCLSSSMASLKHQELRIRRTFGCY